MTIGATTGFPHQRQRGVGSSGHILNVLKYIEGLSKQPFIVGHKQVFSTSLSIVHITSHRLALTHFPTTHKTPFITDAHETTKSQCECGGAEEETCLQLSVSTDCQVHSTAKVSTQTARCCSGPVGHLAGTCALMSPSSRVFKNTPVVTLSAVIQSRAEGMRRNQISCM